jgi:4'-phosphopantetheinyl transferase
MVIKHTSNDLEPTSIHIWRINLDGPIPDLTDHLSADEIIDAEAKKLPKVKQRFILGRGAMRSILGEYLGVPGAELEFVRGEKGKPAIKNHNLNIEFNLSHCEEMAILAVSKQVPVGIDLECIQYRSSLMKVAQRMFPEEIYLELKQLSSAQFYPAFFNYWTELEAKAKCVGDGIFSPVTVRDDIKTRHFTPQKGWIACIAANLTDPSSSIELKHFVYRY